MTIRPAFDSEAPTVWRRVILYAGELTVVGDLVDPAVVPVGKRRDLYASRLTERAPEVETPSVVAKKKPKKKYRKRVPKDPVLAALTKLKTRKA